MKKLREEYKMTELGEIPLDWKVKRLGEICEIKSSKRVYQSDYVDIGVPFYRSKEIIELSKCKVPEIELYISEEMFNNFKNKYGVPQKGDLLITSVGTIGKTWVSDGRMFYYKDGNITQMVKNDNINVDFISYMFSSDVLKHQYLGQSSGSAQVALTIEKLNKLKIPFPKLEEQKQISLILSSIDEQIEITDNLIDKTKELKKGLLQRLLTKGIEHHRFKNTEIGMIPEEWEVKRLNEIADIKRGASPRPIKDSKWFSDNSKVGWIRISDVTKTKKYLQKTEQYLSKEGILKSRLVHNGDLIMSICATVGKPIIIKMEACIHDGFVVFGKLDKKVINLVFLFYLLENNEDFFRGKGQTGTQANINTNIVGLTQIGVPSIYEQGKISDILTSIDEQIDQYVLKKGKLHELKKGLMQNLLMGQIRVVNN